MTPSRVYGGFFMLAVALSFLSACGGGGSTAVPAATATPAFTAIWQIGTVVNPSQNATTVTLPGVAGGYGGRMLLPAGSGSAVLTLSASPPPAVPPLLSTSGTPALAYLTFKATSAFALAAAPGLTLTVPASAAVAGTYQLNEYGNGWSQLPSSAWMIYSATELCVQSQGPAISLQTGGSLTLAITGDFVLPTPMASPSPCPY